VKAHSSVGYTRETFLKFDLITFASVSSAKLRLYGRLTEAATVPIAVYSTSDTSWSEAALTWNNRPSTGSGTAAATQTISGTTSKWYEWDLTALLKAEKAAGRNIVTLVLRNVIQTNATLVFASDEASANRPELLITP
jgi:endoglucanase